MENSVLIEGKRCAPGGFVRIRLTLACHIHPVVSWRQRPPKFSPSLMSRSLACRARCAITSSSMSSRIAQFATERHPAINRTDVDFAVLTDRTRSATYTVPPRDFAGRPATNFFVGYGGRSVTRPLVVCGNARSVRSAMASTTAINPRRSRSDTPRLKSDSIELR